MRATGFMLEGVEETKGLDNSTSTCTLNSILMAFINSDLLTSLSNTILNKIILQDNKQCLFTYLKSKSIPRIKWVQEIFNALVKCYEDFGKDIPETFRTRIQFLIRKKEYTEIMKPYKFMRMEERFKHYESYLKGYHRRSGIHTKQEAENISVLCHMNYHEVFQMLDSNVFTLLPANNIDSSKKMWNDVKVAFEDNMSDIFIYMKTRYIYDPLPIYQLMMMSYNGYICTDICLYQDAGHQVYYDMLDNYIQNNSKHCYLPLYDLIFTSQDSIVKIRKNISRLMITEAKRVAFYDETNTYAVRFAPTLLHFQKLNPSDINNSVYAKKPTVNKVKNTLECLIMRLKFLLTVINAHSHSEYYDNIKSVLSIYSSIDKHNKESIFNAWTSLHDMPYNMFETYLDKSGRMFQASKVLQDLYDEA